MQDVAEKSAALAVPKVVLIPGVEQRAVQIVDIGMAAVPCCEVEQQTAQDTDEGQKAAGSVVG